MMTRENQDLFEKVEGLRLMPVGTMATFLIATHQHVRNQ
jgi:hypothetical protein